MRVPRPGLTTQILVAMAVAVLLGLGNFIGVLICNSNALVGVGSPGSDGTR